MAICSPARAPISSISLSAGIKRPFDFIIFGSFTWKQELDGENLSNLFSLGWCPLNPSGGGRTSPLGAETKISLKHVAVKSTWHSARNFVRAQEMSLFFSSSGLQPCLRVSQVLTQQFLHRQGLQGKVPLQDPPHSNLLVLSALKA